LAASRTIIIAGAGIGGLTAALALSQKGFRVALFDQAERLQETGAGIQLSPNATRVLAALGLTSRLAADVVAPEAIEVVSAKTGREIVRIPLGSYAHDRYGSPYWSIHRGDLQAALLAAVADNPDIALTLGAKADDFAIHAEGITVGIRQRADYIDERGIALIGADGLWSSIRARLRPREHPRFADRTAWRAIVRADSVAPEFRTPMVRLWLGRNAHLVHYPVKAGAVINLVAIVGDHAGQPGWSVPGRREDLLARYPASGWSPAARALLAIPEQWLKWSLYDRGPIWRWGHGPMTLLGDAAHPMLPFLAQGAAMAIEDAAVLANRLAQSPDDPAGALRGYEIVRRARTARVQRGARRNRRIYHLGGPEAFARDTVMRLKGGGSLLARYDWLYDWRPD
jgi:salicylate hydroxylase